MKLLTKEIRRKLPPLYSQDGKPCDEQLAVVKFFCPWSSWTWFATEGQPEEGDFRFFGLVFGQEREWGYWMLSELEAIRGPWGLKIERDLYFEPRVMGSIAGVADTRISQTAVAA